MENIFYVALIPIKSLTHRLFPNVLRQHKNNVFNQMNECVQSWKQTYLHFQGHNCYTLYTCAQIKTLIARYINNYSIQRITEWMKFYYNINYEYMTFLYVVHVYMFCNVVLYCFTCKGFICNKDYHYYNFMHGVDFLYFLDLTLWCYIPFGSHISQWSCQINFQIDSL